MTTQRTWTIPLAVAFAMVLTAAAAHAQESPDEIDPIVNEIEQLTGDAPEPAETPATAPAIPEDAPDPDAIPGEMPDTDGIPEEDLLFLEEDDPAIPVASKTTSAEGMELISISLDDVPLEDVVRMFTRVSGVNIIATATNLEGSVTVNLVDVEWKPALTAILDMHNLSLTEKIPGSGVYSILPKQADAPEPMIVETLFLEYTTVDDVLPVLKGIMAPGATVQAFASRNAFVLKSTSANLGEVGQVLKLVDIPGQQVCIEAKFMELSDSASKQLGIRWDSLGEFNITAGLGPFSWNRTVESTESSTDTATDYDNRSSSETITTYYDADGNQYDVVEDVEVLEVSDTESLLIETLDPTTTLSDSAEAGSDLSSTAVDSFTETITESQSAILDMDDFNIVLSALKETEGVSVISNPKLIVANGEVGAFFTAGDQEPIIREEVVLATGENQRERTIAELDTSIDTEFIKEGYLKTGINLEVVPVVKAEGLIQAEIKPSLRRKVSDKEVSGNTWPVINVKEIHTRFTLRDQQTVAIGGLTNSEDSKETTKVPLLGDIPFLGKYLFSHTKDVTKQTETIIFVTLALAQPEELAPEKGIPEDAELVHRRLLQDAARRAQFRSDLLKMQEAMAAESQLIEDDAEDGSAEEPGEAGDGEDAGDAAAEASVTESPDTSDGGTADAAAEEPVDDTGDAGPAADSEPDVEAVENEEPSAEAADEAEPAE